MNINSKNTGEGKGGKKDKTATLLENQNQENAQEKKDNDERDSEDLIGDLDVTDEEKDKKLISTEASRERKMENESMLTAKNNEELLNLLREWKESTKKQASTEARPSPSGNTDDEDDEYLDEPKYFFAPVSSFAVFGYKNNSLKSVFPPNGAECIEFKPVARYQMPDSKKVISICSAVARTKKELAFLVENPRYNIDYYSSTKEVTEIAEEEDLLKYEEIKSAADKVARLQRHEIIATAKRIGVEVIEDLNLLRKRIAIKMGTSSYNARKTNRRITSAKDPFENYEEHQAR